jgi:hypothetical protein
MLAHFIKKNAGRSIGFLLAARGHQTCPNQVVDQGEKIFIVFQYRSSRSERRFLCATTQSFLLTNLASMQTISGETNYGAIS